MRHPVYYGEKWETRLSIRHSAAQAQAGRLYIRHSAKQGQAGRLSIRHLSRAGTRDADNLSDILKSSAVAGRQSIYYTFYGTGAGKQTSFWIFYSKGAGRQAIYDILSHRGRLADYLIDITITSILHFMKKMLPSALCA